MHAIPPSIAHIKQRTNARNRPQIRRIVYRQDLKRRAAQLQHLYTLLLADNKQSLLWQEHHLVIDEDTAPSSTAIRGRHGS